MPTVKLKKVERLYFGEDFRRADIDEIGHLDAFLLEEVIQLDVLAVLGRAADPLTVADQQITELTAGV